jgi:hypothetical protein
VDNDPVQAMDALLTRTCAALSGSGTRDGEPTTGTAADGRVATTVGTNGRVGSLTIDATMLRGSPDSIAAAIRDAVNEALDAQPDTAPAATLIEELKAIQEETLGHMQQLSGTLTTALTRMETY